MNVNQTFRPITGWIVALTSSLINFVVLIRYQSSIGGDFPFQDEWGYVDRLINLHQTGFFHYLFDRYQVYYQPGLFVIWYFFYKFFHLSIMAMRYTGAGISAIIAFGICSIAIGQKEQLRRSELILIGLIPFVFCSLNHFATYNQSIESIIEPLLFGFIFLSCWAGKKTMECNAGQTWIWFGAIIIFVLMGLSMYAPALSILLAIAIARGVLLREVDFTTFGLGLLGLAGGLAYSIFGGGTGHFHALMNSSIEKDLIEWVILFGNAVVAIGSNTILIHSGAWGEYSAHQIAALVGGLIIISALIIIMVRAVFAPDNDRKKYFIPFVLSLYTFGVSLEITLIYNDPNFGEVPRYAIHMVGGPIAILVWGILDSIGLKKIIFVNLANFFIFVGTASVLTSVSAKTPFIFHSFNEIREELDEISAPISARQQKSIFVGNALRGFVFPDLQFLRKNKLAMFYVKKDK